MKVLIVNASDTKGGAAVIAYRLLCALNAYGKGVQAKMLVAEKHSDNEAVVALPRRWWLKKALDRAVVWAANGFTKRNLWLTDGGFFGTDITTRKEFKEADVIHLHWVNQGFLGLKDIEKILQSGKKVVWTMHDLWAITGGCHIPSKCERYSDAACEACPLLKKDLLAKAFRRKRAMFQAAKNLQFVAVSHWVKACFDRSALVKDLGLRCNVINNPMPVEQFAYERKPRKSNEIVLTMGAARLDDPVKGFPLLIEALEECAKNERFGKRLRLILYGDIRNKTLLDRLTVPYIYKGVLTQKEVAEVFLESDVVLSCSEYETFGATLAEGIASGCLAVTRGTGGQRDVVEHKKTGYVVEEAEPFANGILWAANQIDADFSLEKRKALHEEMQKRLSSEVIIQQYLSICKQ